MYDMTLRFVHIPCAEYFNFLYFIEIINISHILYNLLDFSQLVQAFYRISGQKF